MTLKVSPEVLLTMRADAVAFSSRKAGLASSSPSMVAVEGLPSEETSLACRPFSPRFFRLLE